MRRLPLIGGLIRRRAGARWCSNLLKNVPKAPQVLPDMACEADMRSDTKTQPDAAMYKAMLNATLGDDVAGECPTTNELEIYVAGLLGKEAAVMVSSGTQGNLLAIASQCPHGTEFLTGNESHIHLWEAGGTSVLFGIMQRTVCMDAAGRLPLADLEIALEQADPNDDHCCITKLVSIENTNGARGGAVLDPPYVDAVANLCHERGIRLHVDGARLFNAVAWMAAPGESLACATQRLMTNVDTVSVCLSKGLGCPGGAIIAGDAKTIAKCRRLRKLVGGSTRQAAGLLAAAGLYVLRERDLLSDLQRDNALMKQLVDRLVHVPGFELQHYGGTNMAVVSLSGPRAGARAADMVAAAKAAGVNLGGPYSGADTFRLVTHRGVSEEAVDTLLEVFAAHADSVPV